MNGYQLLKKLNILAKTNGWEIVTRKGATTHLILHLTRTGLVTSACIPMHKNRDLRKGTLSNIFKTLKLKEKALEK